MYMDVTGKDREAVEVSVYAWRLRASHTGNIWPNYKFMFFRALQVYFWRSYTSPDIISQQEVVENF